MVGCPGHSGCWVAEGVSGAREGWTRGYTYPGWVAPVNTAPVPDFTELGGEVVLYVGGWVVEFGGFHIGDAQSSF